MTCEQRLQAQAEEKNRSIREWRQRFGDQLALTVEAADRAEKAEARVRDLERELLRALAEWRMYAEEDEERDLDAEDDAEAQLYRASKRVLEARP